DGHDARPDDWLEPAAASAVRAWDCHYEYVDAGGGSDWNRVVRQRHVCRHERLCDVNRRLESDIQHGGRAARRLLSWIRTCPGGFRPELVREAHVLTKRGESAGFMMAQVRLKGDVHV